MMKWILIGVGGGVLAVVIAILAWLMWPVSGYDEIPEGLSSQRLDVAVRGAQLIAAAGCISCHWDHANRGRPFAGGRALKTPFGTFYSPNITPDPETGIGNWSDAEFVAAFKHGRRPDGSNLFPVFPYTSYGKMPVEDILAIKAYLFRVVKPVKAANKEHEVGFPWGWRPLVTAWKALYFDPTPPPRNPELNDSYHRGQYLVEVLAHCGECHTERDWLGGVNRSMNLAGTRAGVDGRPVPNITADIDTGIGAWTINEIMFFLKTGIKPNYRNARGPMQEVIQHRMKALSDADLFHIVNYLRTLPEIRNDVGLSVVSAPAAEPVTNPDAAPVVPLDLSRPPAETPPQSPPPPPGAEVTVPLNLGPPPAADSAPAVPPAAEAPATDAPAAEVLPDLPLEEPPSTPRPKPR